MEAGHARAVEAIGRESVDIADLPCLLAPWCEVSTGPGGAFVATDGRGADSACAVVHLPCADGPLVLRGPSGEPRFAVGPGWAAGFAAQTSRISVYGILRACDVAIVEAMRERCGAAAVTAFPRSRVLRAVSGYVEDHGLAWRGDPIVRGLAALRDAGLAVIPLDDAEPVFVGRERFRRVMRDLADYGLPPPVVDDRAGLAAFVHILRTGVVPPPCHGPTLTREQAIEDLRRLLALADGERPRYVATRRIATRIVVPFSMIEAFWMDVVDSAIATYRRERNPDVIRDALELVSRPPRLEGWTWVVETSRPIPMWATICEWGRGFLTWPRSFPVPRN